MAAFQTACWIRTLLLVGFVSSVSADQIIITAVTGQTITLPCGAPENRTVIVVEWSRTDLGSDYVLRYRDEQFQTELQHPSFKDRVDLQDRQMKDGDVSLVLKNVTINDTGTYECRVVQRGERERKLIRIIYLDVSPPGELCQSVCLKQLPDVCC
ncbi:nectin-4-like isoform X2 [Kryptolebias marmoratus]|uniref:nectin-4-like isoform X2 n=1 Tax=Kryptolebias marmoratus TaxID=37003 RepID=UPI0007F893DF|nr:nectin-4-like isoform X2 [Kryptolebias marmoratus]